MVDGRESSISFDELHKKLITRELTLQQRSSASSFSATVNVARHNNYKPQSFQSRFSQHASPASRAPSHAHPATPTSFYTPKSYLGKCQACRKPGHSASRCPEFSLVPASCGNARPSSPLPAPSSWQPQAHVATLASNIPPTWLLDSGAFHHVTASLDNMSLLSPYEGTDDIVIGDGSADGGDNSRRQS